MTITQDTTAPPSYDPENLGAWPKVFDRLAWADGVVKARFYRNATAAVFHRVTTRAGTPEGCTESVPNIALGLGLCLRAVQGAIKAIRADGYMDIQEHKGHTYTCVPMLEKTVETLAYPGNYCAPTPAIIAPLTPAIIAPKGNSSSKESLKKTDPVAVAAKRGNPPRPEDGGTTCDLKPFSEEEGATEPDTTPNPMKADVQEQAPTPNPPKAPPSQGITRQATEAFMDGNIAEIPMDHEVEWMLKHCWDWWVYPAHPYGWKHGPEAALKTCTKDTAGRVKFRKDLVDKLMLAGLPKPQEVDADNEWARKVTAEIMDRRIAEDAQTREKGAHCAGCGRKRQLPPGVTHCSPCRKELVEVAAP